MERDSSSLMDFPDRGVLYHEISTLRQTRDFDSILGRLSVGPIDTVLDICCGSGHFVEALLNTNRVTKAVFGLDHSSAMIRVAKRLIGRYPNVFVQFRQADILWSPHVPETFNLIGLFSACNYSPGFLYRSPESAI